jgi:LPXTG-motif cell wall-anchored protein
MPLLHRAIEVALLLGLMASIAYWGWQTGSDATRWMLAIGGACVIGALWLALRWIGAVSGRFCLIAELAVVGIAATAVWTAGSRAASETLLTAFGVHYALTWERLSRLARNAGA